MRNVVKIVDHNLIFFCIGCKEIHAVNLDPQYSPVYTWNEDFERPTISPFVSVSRIRNLTDEERIIVDDLLFKYDYRTVCDGLYGYRCESHIADGIIKYFYHSTHELKGQTLLMEPIQ